jgi:aspartate oxidase
MATQDAIGPAHDVVIIGSGAAGLTAALALAETRRVLVLAKGSLTGGSTAWAQGGIAAVLDTGDTFENHVRDTMVAGAGLNDLATVEFVIERAPRQAVPQAWLAKWHVLRVHQGLSPDPEADVRHARERIGRALQSDSHCSLALAVDGGDLVLAQATVGVVSGQKVTVSTWTLTMPGI